MMKCISILSKQQQQRHIFPRFTCELSAIQNNISVNVLLEMLLTFGGQAFPRGFQQWEGFSVFCIL